MPEDTGRPADDPPSDDAGDDEWEWVDSADDPDGPPVDSSTGESASLLTRFRTAESGPLMFLREVAKSVAAVALVGLLLFAISGVWPPMVAVESGSMQPNMQKGDLVFITEPTRYEPGAAFEDTGVVTYRDGETAGYRSFGSYGSVIVYARPGNGGPPIIHRARFWVNEGENWYDKADEDYIYADNCEELRYCPAPNAGFVTKGDNNNRYDQANGISTPVAPDSIKGVAQVRVPYLGWVRLGVSGSAQPDYHSAGDSFADPGFESDGRFGSNRTATVTPAA